MRYGVLSIIIICLLIISGVNAQQITHQFKIPVKYIGIGEKIEDLQVFNRAEFVDSLFSH